jgi:hypothetical protein
MKTVPAQISGRRRSRHRLPKAVTWQTAIPDLPKQRRRRWHLHLLPPVGHDYFSPGLPSGNFCPPSASKVLRATPCDFVSRPKASGVGQLCISVLAEAPRCTCFLIIANECRHKFVPDPGSFQVLMQCLRNTRGHFSMHDMPVV